MEFGNSYNVIAQVKDGQRVDFSFKIAELTQEQREAFEAIGQPKYGFYNIREWELFDYWAGWEVRTVLSEYKFDTTPDAVTVLATIVAIAAHKRELEAQLPALRAEAERKQAEITAKLAQERAEEQARKEEKRAKIIAANSTFEWNNGKAICDLYTQIVAVAGIYQDNRFSSNWVKRITAVDTSKQNGYCFQGEFINSGTVEITNEPQLFLIAGTSGSRKNNTTTYLVVVLVNGKLERTEIQTDNGKSGWALRIRDAVAAKLTEITRNPEVKAEEPRWFAGDDGAFVLKTADAAYTLSASTMEELTNLSDEAFAELVKLMAIIRAEID